MGDALSSGSIVGIVIGCVVFIFITTYLVLQSRRGNKELNKQDPEANNRGWDKFSKVKEPQAEAHGLSRYASITSFHGSDSKPRSPSYRISKKTNEIEYQDIYVGRIDENGVQKFSQPNIPGSLHE